MSKREKSALKSGEVLFVPLNKLKKSPKNVRKVPHAKEHIESLAASIAAKGLLQNLVVEPERGAGGKETGNYLVTIGEGRRLAQTLRAKRKEIAKTEPVRCVLDTEHNAHEISLAENVIRAPMHPADQYEAFAQLHTGEGQSAEDIAARFGVTPAVVKQRLKLGAVSPKLMQAYREEELTLEALMAFAITDDHAKQEQVWAELPEYQRNRRAILEALTEGQISSEDRRAVFVGVEAYQAAGGAIIRDLFDEDSAGFFTDAALLNRLVREKLQAAANSVLAEGWKWVTVETEFDYQRTAGMRRVEPEAVPLSDAEQARLEELERRYNDLCDSDDGENSEDIATEAQRLEAEIETLTGTAHYRPEDIARAGAFVSLGRDGEPRIERGFLRREDEAASDGETVQGGMEDGAPGAVDGSARLADKLVAELTSYRTSGLRNALAKNPPIALIAVVHALAAAAFYGSPNDSSCLELAWRSASLSTHAPGIADSPAEREIAARHEHWANRLPDDVQLLWPVLVALPHDQLLALLAHCASLTVNAIRVPRDRQRGGVHAHADVLAEAITLDMTTTWEPTVASYFSRVSKDRILDAVREGVSPEAAENIAGLKKAAMAEAAAERLTGKGWLPAPLRTGVPSAVTETAEAA